MIKEEKMKIEKKSEEKNEKNRQKCEMYRRERDVSMWCEAELYKRDKLLKMLKSENM